MRPKRFATPTCRDAGPRAPVVPSGRQAGASLAVVLVLPAAPAVLLGVGGPAEQEMERTRTLLATTAEPVLRVHEPVPTVAFGRRETHRDGYRRAVAAARAHGFEPVVRNAGGQAVAYGHGSLVVELISPDPSAALRLRDRFDAFAAGIARALRSVGVDARVGPVDGEYCPGEHSVNGGGTVKLAGVAQRMTMRGWLCSASVVVTGADPLRAVLVDVYEALGAALRPETVAAVTDLAPHATVSTVRDAIIEAFGGVV